MTEAKSTVLLNVDDDPASRYARSRVLVRAGFKVLEASSGQEALRLVGEGEPEMLLLDVDMPGMSGIEVVERLRADPATSTMPIVHISATAVTDDDRSSGLDLGADAYLVEPVDPRLLISTVNAVLRMRRAEAERDRLVHQLELESAQLRGLVQQMPVGVVVAEAPSGRVLLSNAQADAIRGSSSLARDVSEYTSMQGCRADGTPLSPEEFPLARSILLGETVANEEIRFQRDDGSWRISQVSSAPIRNREGHIVAGVATIWDITERKLREDQVQRLNDALQYTIREIEAFSYTVSHDLKAPLRAMIGFSDALLQDYGDKLDDQARHFIQRIHGSGRQMSQLFDDLINLARVTREDMERETVNLSDLVRSIAGDLQASAPGRPVEWVIQRGIIVTGDMRLLRIALHNLIENAWKFTARESVPRIEFGVQEQDSDRVLFVRDNGVGFDMEYAEKLFSAFQRLHSINEFEGTGIGLPIVQRIVQRHGGKIWGEGRPGAGATFYFTLR